MKIIFTVADSTDAAHIGGEVTRKSAILEIPEESIPELVKQYFIAEAHAIEIREKFGPSSGGFFGSMSISYAP